MYVYMHAHTVYMCIYINVHVHINVVPEESGNARHWSKPGAASSRARERMEGCLLWRRLRRHRRKE